MANVSVVVPVRNYRTEQLLLCIEALLECGSDAICEVIVVDFGSEEPVQAPSDPRVRVVRVEADTWSLAEAINVGVASAVSPVIIKVDADMLVPRYAGKRLDAAAKSVLDGDAGLFLAQPIDLPPELDAKEAAAKAREVSCADDWGVGHVRPRWGEGGLTVFTVDKWNELGGLDARFTSWGNEDNDFARRVRFSGGRIVWLDYGTAVHVWHPPAASKPENVAQIARNRELFNRDKSVMRSNKFRNSNFADIATPDILNKIRPLVTLAIATSDRTGRDQMICEAIMRFQGQIDNDFETVVVDNGSSKAATLRLKTHLAALKGIAPVRIEVLEQGSIPAARNVASEVARGRYICVVDDDDLALPNRLADHLRPFETDPGLHGTHGGWIDFDDATGQIEVNPGRHRTIETLLAGSGKVTAHPACFYRTDVMRAIPYDEAFELGSDLDVAIRQGLHGLRIAHTESYVVLRRFHATNVTRTGFSKQLDSGGRTRARL